MTFLNFFDKINLASYSDGGAIILLVIFSPSLKEETIFTEKFQYHSFINRFPSYAEMP
jgi:hypothetical protein